MSELRFESFTVQGEFGSVDPRGAEFVHAIDYGFLEAVREKEHLLTQLDRFRADGALLSAVYDDDQDPRSVESARPVGTFGEYLGEVCVVEGTLLPAFMITEVTVRGTHRRRGILSRQMRQGLERARKQALPLALLTASEGGIYGRFGFGMAAESATVTVKVRDGLGLRAPVAEALKASGLRTFVPSWEAFPGIYEEAFAAFQLATPGQTGHTKAYRDRAAGKKNPWGVPGVDRDWRPLVVVDEAGAVQGYAISFVKDVHEDGILHVADLGAAHPLAELALWEALAATDLVESLRWREAPLDFALPAALVNYRDVATEHRTDHLWARVLDVVAVIEARGLAQDGAVALKVSDRLGLIEGEYLLTRQDGETLVKAGPAPSGTPTLEMDAETLGSVVFGTSRVADLVALGRIRSIGATGREAGWLLDTERAARNSYTF